jgi:hypothetical protein
VDVPKRQGRKLLVAAIGVATVRYVISCAHTGDTAAELPVANLVVAPDMVHDAMSTDTIDESPIANLVVSPDSH